MFFVESSAAYGHGGHVLTVTRDRGWFREARQMPNDFRGLFFVGEKPHRKSPMVRAGGVPKNCQGRPPVS
jgi:hypothetical protein